MKLKKYIEKLALASPDFLTIFAERAFPVFAYINYSKELYRNEFLSLEDKKSIQFKKLKVLLECAQEKVPYYRRLFRQIGFSADQFKDLSDITNIPVLTKNILKEKADQFISEDYSKRSLIIKYTSGSTGNPLSIFGTERELYSHTAIISRMYKMAGVNMLDNHFDARNIFYCDRSVRRLSLKTQIKKLFIKSSWHEGNYLITYNEFKSDQNSMHKIIKEIILDKDKQFMVGWPSYLYFLAQEILNMGLEIKHIKVVMGGGEHCPRNKVKLIEKAFGAQYFDFYGMRERAVYALDCGKGHGMHVDMNSCFVEHLQNNRILATSFINYAMPLIRYDTGDLGVIDYSTKCPCGRKEPLLTELSGRYTDLIKLEDGTTYSCAFLYRLFSDFSHVKESRFVYYAKENKIIYEAVAGPLFNVAQFEEEMSAKLKGKVKCGVRRVDKISRNKSGKINAVEIVNQ